MTMLPLPTTAEVATRIGVAESTRVARCIDAAVDILTPRVDADLVYANQSAWLEGVIGLSVKIYEAGTRGLSQYDGGDGWEMPAPAATSGLWRSQLGVLSPCIASVPQGFA